MAISRRRFLQFGLMGIIPLSGFSRWLDELPEMPQLLRVTASMLRVRASANADSAEVSRCFKDDLLQGYRQIASSAGGAGWVETFCGFVPAGYVQPVQYYLNPVAASITGDVLAEVTVPYTQAYLIDKDGAWVEINRLYYGSVHWVTALREGPDRQAWYQIVDWYGRNYFALAATMRICSAKELEPIRPEIANQQKWIEVNIGEQRLVAYENGVAILDTAISSGLPLDRPLESDELPTETPYGDFFITVKSASRPMGAKTLSNDRNTTALPGVPWVSFFDKDGYSLHGTYWHNNFGHRMSHGCINMRNEDAKWIFRWANPGYYDTNGKKEVTGWGTRVRIMP
jgi:lipoprotein-anchoring transpeptidase ErfK/SrfK